MASENDEPLDQNRLVFAAGFMTGLYALATGVDVMLETGLAWKASKDWRELTEKLRADVKGHKEVGVKQE